MLHSSHSNYEHTKNIWEFVGHNYKGMVMYDCFKVYSLQDYACLGLSQAAISVSPFDPILLVAAVVVVLHQIHS